MYQWVAFWPRARSPEVVTALLVQPVTLLGVRCLSLTSMLCCVSYSKSWLVLFLIPCSVGRPSLYIQKRKVKHSNVLGTNYHAVDHGWHHGRCWISITSLQRVYHHVHSPEEGTGSGHLISPSVTITILAVEGQDSDFVLTPKPVTSYNFSTAFSYSIWDCVICSVELSVLNTPFRVVLYWLMRNSV